MTPKISIVTPTLNAAATVEAAILSVLAQNYPDFEHIIVDGGSDDATLDICSRFPHLRIAQDNRKGQSDALNTGFELATGEIFGCLNADDIYLPHAFARAASAITQGAYFVVGSVLYLDDHGRCLRNTPRTSLAAMLRHWEPDAFCINPAGYFYRREVHAAVGGFRLDNHYSMDLEFLLAAAARFELQPLDPARPMGIFYSFASSKTAEQGQQDQALWSRRSFPFIDQYLGDLPPSARRGFEWARRLGYAARRSEQRLASLALTRSSSESLPRRLVLGLWMSLRSLITKLLRLGAGITGRYPAPTQPGSGPR